MIEGKKFHNCVERKKNSYPQNPSFILRTKRLRCNCFINNYGYFLLNLVERIDLNHHLCKRSRFDGIDAMSRDLSVPKCMQRWRIEWNKVYWSPKQYHFSRCTYPGPFLWITLRRSLIPWRRLTFPVAIQSENNINNLKILPSISQHLNNVFWTICHQNSI